MTVAPGDVDRTIRLALFQHACDNPPEQKDINGKVKAETVVTELRAWAKVQTRPEHLAHVMHENGVDLDWLVKTLRSVAECARSDHARIAAVSELRNWMIEIVASFPAEREYVRRALSGETLEPQVFDDPILKAFKLKTAEKSSKKDKKVV